jgi:hypothetical protein
MFVRWFRKPEIDSSGKHVEATGSMKACGVMSFVGSDKITKGRKSVAAGCVIS